MSLLASSLLSARVNSFTPCSCLQAAATHDGPFLNLLNHITDPFGSNILTELQYVNE
jgi:hypothetical protein